MFSSTINNEVHRFQLKNIYLMALLLIDEKPNKKIFYTDLIKEIRPSEWATSKSKRNSNSTKYSSKWPATDC